MNAVMTVDSNSGFDGLDRAICVRMKSTLTKRGCHFKTPGYRVCEHTPVILSYLFFFFQ